MASGWKLSKVLWVLLFPCLVTSGRVTQNENFVIITKAWDVNKVEKAINHFQKGLEAKIDIIEISGEHAWLTYVNSPCKCYFISFFVRGDNPVHV